MRTRVTIASALAAMWVCVCSAETPPGLPDTTFRQDELFTFISQMPVVRDEDRVHTPLENPEFALLLNGYVVIPGRQHTSMFDFSDPYDPKLLNRVEMYEKHSHMPEMNGWGLTTGYGGVHLAHADTNSITFWDFTDHMNAEEAGTVVLPHPINPGNCPTRRLGWGFPIAHAWQAPYLYSVMRGIGIDIVDVRDINNPVFVKRVDECGNGAQGYLSVGVVNVVGNLLIHSGHVYSRYIQVMDISDPENPVELDFVGGGDTPLKNLYCGFINGNRYFASGPAVWEYDISDPTNITFVRTYNRTGECDHECSTGGTCVQDNFLHWGGSRTGYEKFDLTTGQSVGVTGPLTNPEKPDNPQYADMDLVTVFGNLTVVCSEDQYQVITLVPHQSEPDRNPPVVNMVNPADGAQDMATTSRIGFTFTDNIDHRSLSTQTIIIRPEGGEAINGKYSVNKSIVNFSPDACLEKNTCYEVVVPVGGVKDYAGNAITEEFTSTFCTGESGNEEVCRKRAEMDPTAIVPGAVDLASGRGNGRIHCRAFMHGNDIPHESAGRIYDTRGRSIGSHETGLRRSLTKAKGVYLLVQKGRQKTSADR